MDPNQQPNGQPTPEQPQQYPPQPAPGQPDAFYQPAPQPIPQQPQMQPQTPSSYSTAPQPVYDPNYLDSIAPPPPPPKFFSGSFGKIFFGLLIVFFLVVSVIIAFSGKDETADLQLMAVRLDKFELIVKTQQKNLKSSKLSNTNTNFQIWLSGNRTQADKLLQLGGIKKSQYSKTMLSSESKISDDLTKKYEDALLNAKLDRIYASSMSTESEKLMNLLNTMAKKNKSKQIREFAKTASGNLAPIHDSFDKYVEDGTN